MPNFLTISAGCAYGTDSLDNLSKISTIGYIRFLDDRVFSECCFWKFWAVIFDLKIFPYSIDCKYWKGIC